MCGLKEVGFGFRKSWNFEMVRLKFKLATVSLYCFSNLCLVWVLDGPSIAALGNPIPHSSENWSCSTLIFFAWFSLLSRFKS